MTLNDTPDGGVVNGVVAMDDTVTKTHDTVEICNTGGCRGVDLRQPVQCFADNFKFTLDGPTELAIFFVFGKATPLAPFADASAGYEHIKQELLRAVVHREVGE